MAPALRLQSGRITTGGAAPLASPSGPFTFIDKAVVLGGATLLVTPVTVEASLAGCSIDSAPANVTLPVYLDAMGASALYLPFRNLRFQSGTFSADHSCIGSYDAVGLDPVDQCVPDAQHPLFIDGAGASGHFI